MTALQVKEQERMRNPALAAYLEQPQRNYRHCKHKITDWIN